MLQVNIKSIGRKRFARLSDNKAEIHVRKNSRSQSIKKTNKTIGMRWGNILFKIYKKKKWQLKQGGREHAVGQRCAFHVAVCGGKQKVRFAQV